LHGGTTLLLLHGTGGDEDNLVWLGRTLLPGAALLSPRGKVDEGGSLRFFRRIREGVFDLEDLARRTQELGGFIERAATTYGLDPDRIVAVGFSNGANIAGSLLLRRPGLLKRAILLSPMLPFEPESALDLRGTSVFIGAGRADPLVPAEQTQRLADVLAKAGADVQVHWEPGGHAIAGNEIQAAKGWLARTT
jgi:predicted esterase